MAADAESSCTESRTDSWAQDGARNPWSAPTTELWVPTRGWSIREAADKADISEKTVFNLLHGQTWGDVPTIARIEMNLRIRLWVNQQNTLGPPD